MQEEKRLRRRDRELRKLRQKKRRRRRLLVLVVELIILCVLGVAAYGMFKLDLLNHTIFNEDSILNNGVNQDGFKNIALFGTDNRAGETSGVRSDCIIVASINSKTKEVRMLSVYRDTMLQQEDGVYDKANSAYATGGAEAAVNMLNRNLDLDITDYVTVNFLALAEAVDLLGGIELDLTDEEVVHMNNYCVETSDITGKSYERIEPEVAGTYHLNGVQAVSYARIRYTAGGDFERTSRQRLVIEKLVEKAKKADLGTINKVIDAVFPEVSTSFSSTEIIGLAADVFKYELGENSGFPFTPATPDSIPGYSGSYVVAEGLAENVKQAHEFLFGAEDYEPTEVVQQISDELCYITGIYPETNEEQTEDTQYDAGSE